MMFDSSQCLCICVSELLCSINTQELRAAKYHVIFQFVDKLSFSIQYEEYLVLNITPPVTLNSLHSCSSVSVTVARNAYITIGSQILSEKERMNAILVICFQWPRFAYSMVPDMNVCTENLRLYV